VHRLPSIRFGTERYPEQVARRLRALNLTVWITVALTAGFAVVQFLDPTPGLWKVGVVNALTALITAVVPLLHRFGQLAASLIFLSVVYVTIFVIVVLLGTGTGMRLYYLVATALAVLFFGTERIVLAAVFGVLAAALTIVLQLLVPYNTGTQSSAVQFGNFVATVVACCVFLLTIVFYALCEAARAEAAAEREHARSEALLANILPAEIARRLKTWW
jgi:adenylate cyclase